MRMDVHLYLGTSGVICSMGSYDTSERGPDTSGN